MDNKRIASPAKELSFMVDFVAKIYKELKPEAFHTKEEIAIVHRLAPNSVKSLLSTAQQYNLLEMKYGTGYKILPLFSKIYFNEGNAVKTAAITESLLYTELYRNILKEYNEKLFPEKQQLRTVFQKRYNVKETIATKIVNVLFKNLEDFNFINPAGILKLNLAEQQVIENKAEKAAEKELQRISEVKPEKIAVQTEKKNKETIEIVIPIRNNQRIVFKIPEDISNNELEKIARIILAYKEIA